MNYNHTLSLISFAISDKEANMDLLNWKEQFDFFRSHAIAPLVSDLNQHVQDNNIKKTWKESVYSNIYTYYNLVKRQNQILDAFKVKNIPVVVLKGTSAAKYYPKPQLRTMGDIDLLVRPEYYEDAVSSLICVGCDEITSKAEAEAGRHRSFRYNDVSIELHHYFSLISDRDKADALDNLLYDAISLNSTELPDVENGLVLLSHIRQHLEGGLGLRQIVDWFMFVRSCLDDETWYSSFQEKAQLTGLETLAITVTRMCQIYLGLTTAITWCKDADEQVCNDLMQYVMECGNFGRSREILQSGATSKLPSLKHPIQLFKYIQFHGETNWKVLKKHSWLKPFAWLYQSSHYIKFAIQNRVTPNKFKSIYEEGQRRNEMFASLGIKYCFKQ